MSRSEERELQFRDDVIRVGVGFVSKERPLVRDSLSTLSQHLGRWDVDDVTVDVSLQDRGGVEQRVTLRARLPGRPPVIAVVENASISHALNEAKRDVIRQLEHQTSTRDPMHSRSHRATIRHPVD